jgi:hypothetical protein
MMTHGEFRAAADPASAAASPPPVAPGSLRCVRCGYELFGLDAGGQCPECGAPVRISLRGGRLEFCGEEYLRSLHRGAVAAQAALIASVAAVVVPALYEMIQFMQQVAAAAASTATTAVASATTTARAFHLPTTTQLGFDLVASLISIYGWWCLTERDPGQRSKSGGEGARRLIRVTIILNGGAALLLFTMHVLGAVTGSPVLSLLQRLGATGRLQTQDMQVILLLLMVMGLGLLSLVAWVASFYAALNYLRWLAPRVPDGRIHRQAARLMWLGPLLYLGGYLCFYIGPLVAMLLFYIMLDWLRRDLKAILARAGDSMQNLRRDTLAQP